MIDTDDRIRNLQRHADNRNAEADAAVDAYHDAPPGHDLALWPAMAAALIRAAEANWQLRRAHDTRKPAEATR